MLQHLGVLKSYVKYVRHPTESFLFYLHYRITFLALVWCCVIVTSRLMVGHPIVCTPTLLNAEIISEVMNAYCWTYGTYSVGTAYTKQLGKVIPHPGVDTSEDSSDFIYRDYYQYVYFVLFLQAALFYLPHGLWKRFENGEFYKMMVSLNNLPSTSDNYTGDTEEVEEEGHSKSHSVVKHRTPIWGCFTKYALQYHFCEALQLLNVVLQIWLLNVFFKGQFVFLGFSSGNLESYREKMDQVFPRVTKCHFKKFGTGGVIDTADVLCILPTNALNEKIYYVTWLWYFGLLILDSLNLCISFASIVFPTLRAFRILLSMKLNHFYKCCSPTDFESLVFKMTRSGNFGDWFMLSSMLAAMDRFDYQTTVRRLYNAIPETAKVKEPDEVITLEEVELSEKREK